MKFFIKKIKNYLKSKDFLQDLVLAILPSILLAVLFYANNLHLAYFDFSLLKYLLYFSFFSFFWIIFWKKTWFSYLSYLPFSFCLSFSSLSVFAYLPYKVWYFYISSFLLIFFLGFLKKFKKFIFVFISIIIITQVAQGIYHSLLIEQQKFEILDNFSTNKYNRFLKKKYNVYYFLIDGYSSQKTLFTQDRLDNSPFINWLKSKGFSTNNNAFSNYGRTYTSMQATFEMKHNYYKNINLNTTETPNGKYIMAGANPVMSRFFNNDFSVYINPYPENFRNEVVDFSKKWDGKVEKKIDIELKKQDIYWFLQYIETVFSTKKYLNLLGNIQLSSKPKILKKIEFSESKIEKNLDKTPFFNILSNIKDENIQFVYLHSTITIDKEPCIKYSKNGFRDGYLQQISCANQDMKQSIEYILEKNPNSIIILQSDHGRGPDTRNIDYGDGSKEIEKYRIKKYIENGNNIQKRFGILFSVKWPKECAYLGKEKYTPVNLFPRVFACLNGEKPDYENMAADDSYLIGAWSDDKNREPNEVFKVIENNEILPEFR